VIGKKSSGEWNTGNNYWSSADKDFRVRARTGVSGDFRPIWNANAIGWRSANRGRRRRIAKRAALWYLRDLKDGVSLEQAGSELSVVSQRLAQQYPKTNEAHEFRVWRLGPDGTELESRGQSDPNSGGALSGTFIFSFGCWRVLNVANMLLVRAAARGREMAVRAGPFERREADLIRQLLAEKFAAGGAGMRCGNWKLALMASRAIGSINLGKLVPVSTGFPVFDWRGICIRYICLLMWRW